jgi:hypothetical protein
MDASVLELYPEILDIPRLRQRADKDATDTELAQIAHEILTKTLGELRTTDRLLAEAILAAGQFEDKSVEERKTQLNNLQYGCSENGYKHRRKPLLEDIVRRLLRAPIDQESAERIIAQSNTTGTKLDRSLMVIAEDSAGLYFAGVATLFTCSLFFAEIRGGLKDFHYPGLSEASWFHWPQVLFDRYAMFVWTTPMMLSHALESPFPEKRDSLDDEVVRPLTTLYEEAVTGRPFPLGSAELAVMEQHAHERSIGLLSDSENRHAVLDLLVPTWIRWYQRQVQYEDYIDTAPVPDIAVILHKVAMIEREVSKRVSYTQSPMIIARQRVHRSLSYFNELDDYLSPSDGRSLRRRADRFFDNIGTILAKEPLIWDNVTMKGLI